MRMTRLYRFALAGLMALVAGCAALSPYSISEGKLEQYLQDELQAFDSEQLRMGSPLSLSFSTVDLDVGPDGRGVMVLDLGGEVALNAFLTKLPVDLRLKIEGAPVYDSSEKAVFIRRLKLLDSRIESPFLTQDLQPVVDTVMRVVAQLLETVPVYRLNEADLGPRLLSMMDLDVKVAPGRLVFVSADDS
jgi:hypothetical protein